MDSGRAGDFGCPDRWIEHGTPWPGMLVVLAVVAGLVVLAVWAVGRTGRVGLAAAGIGPPATPDRVTPETDPVPPAEEPPS